MNLRFYQKSGFDGEYHSGIKWFDVVFVILKDGPSSNSKEIRYFVIITYHIANYIAVIIPSVTEFYAKGMFLKSLFIY
jgi:hypothetical protein